MAPFRKKLLNTKCLFWFALKHFFLKHFAFYEELSEIWSKISSDLNEKYLLFLTEFNETGFSRQFFLNISISNFIKISPRGAELFRTVDGRNDREDETNILITYFVNATKNFAWYAAYFLRISWYRELDQKGTRASLSGLFFFGI
jgi:hypothetical protein